MPTPRERLERLINAHVPSEVVFRVAKRQEGDSLRLDVVVTKPQSWKDDESDPELKLALVSEIQEMWDTESGRYYINATVDSLWRTIKYQITHRYSEISQRSKATKRKTEQFIHDIKLDDRHLPNFLIQVFLTINSVVYDNMSDDKREALFEQFEPLRRTYGKRD